MQERGKFWGCGLTVWRSRVLDLRIVGSERQPAQPGDERRAFLRERSFGALQRSVTLPPRVAPALDPVRWDSGLTPSALMMVRRISVLAEMRWSSERVLRWRVRAAVPSNFRRDRDLASRCGVGDFWEEFGRSVRKSLCALWW
jgi:hypothetical protein